MPLKRIMGVLVGAGAALSLLAVVLRSGPSDHPEAVQAPVAPDQVSGAAEQVTPVDSDAKPSAAPARSSLADVSPASSDEYARDARALVSKWRTQALDDALLNLYEAILAPPVPGIYKSQQDADLNEIMDQLCESEPDSARLAQFFVEIMLDPGRDVVQRDYAIQHLRVACRVLLDEKKAADGEDRTAASEMARNALFEVVPENTCCLAGTALLALTEIAENTPAAVDPGAVSRLALERAGDAHADDGIRLTALLVCAQFQNLGAVPVAWKILETSNQLSLRLAAISALAALGDQDVLERLGRMSAGTDEIEKKARDAAIRKISGRKT